MPTIDGSSMISAIDYADGSIAVTFKNGRVYNYRGTEEDYRAFLAAPSKGKWFNEHIKSARDDG